MLCSDDGPQLEPKPRSPPKLSWPAPPAVMPFATANRIIEWIPAIVDDPQHDDHRMDPRHRPRSICQRLAETYPRGQSALILLDCVHAEPSLKLLEAIRNSRPDQRIPESLFENLLKITVDGNNLVGSHGIYAHHIWARMAPNRREHLVYFGKGTGKVTNFFTLTAQQYRPEEIGIFRRWKDYFAGGRQIARPDLSSHPTYDSQLRYHRLTRRALRRPVCCNRIGHGYDGIRHALGRNVRRLFLIPPKTGQQSCGADQNTKELTEAYWRFVKSFVLVASGSPMSRFLGDVYRISSTHYQTIRQTIPLNRFLQLRDALSGGFRSRQEKHRLCQGGQHRTRLQPSTRSIRARTPNSFPAGHRHDLYRLSGIDSFEWCSQSLYPGILGHL
jgi:hypothetical protein